MGSARENAKSIFSLPAMQGTDYNAFTQKIAASESSCYRALARYISSYTPSSPMQNKLTPRQLKRLKGIRSSHDRPPTWGRFLPKAFLYGSFWLILLLCEGLLLGGRGSKIFYFCLGLAWVFPLSNFAFIRLAVNRWPVLDQVIDWARVDELIDSASRPGV